jgi:L-threonylcarbamoyladenylate synthase
MKHVASLDNEHTECIVQCLQNGGVVVLPTDTVIGLAVSPKFNESVARLYAIKARPRAKHLAVMVETVDQIIELGAKISPSAKALLNSNLMPGALTLVLPITAETAPEWLLGRAEIAVRIPNHTGLLNLLKHSGPLLVTSANLSGEDTPETAQDAASRLTELPDICVSGHGASSLPSTIVQCSKDPIEILRQGAVSAADIHNALEAS